MLVFVLAACGSGGSPASSRAPSGTGTPSATPSALAVPVLEKGPVSFSLAGGNIACDLEEAYARCDAKKHTWASPKKPRDCNNTWGSTVEVSAGTRAAFICWFGASPLGAKRVLKTGQAITVGLMTCRAYPGSVECSGQGHGFLLGKTGYRLT
jgi:hypothetical protein